METPDQTTETPETSETDTETETPDLAPNLKELGRLTTEEQQILVQLKHETAQYLNKIGEFEVMKARCLVKLDELESKGQQIMASISTRLELDPGVQWVTLMDGSIRLVEQGS